jgi:hypothetical protein
MQLPGHTTSEAPTSWLRRITETETGLSTLEPSPNDSYGIRQAIFENDPVKGGLVTHP